LKLPKDCLNKKESSLKQGARIGTFPNDLGVKVQPARPEVKVSQTRRVNQVLVEQGDMP